MIFSHRKNAKVQLFFNVQDTLNQMNMEKHFA